MVRAPAMRCSRGRPWVLGGISLLAGFAFLATPVAEANQTKGGGFGGGMGKVGGCSCAMHGGQGGGQHQKGPGGAVGGHGKGGAKEGAKGGAHHGDQRK